MIGQNYTIFDIVKLICSVTFSMTLFTKYFKKVFKCLVKSSKLKREFRKFHKNLKQEYKGAVNYQDQINQLDNKIKLIFNIHNEILGKTKNKIHYSRVLNHRNTANE